MIIAVASGEGGTGKTVVATSLALSLQNEKPVQLLDCDVEEPEFKGSLISDKSELISCSYKVVLPRYLVNFTM